MQARPVFCVLRYKLSEKDLTLKPGKASPKLLPWDLRQLPSEFIAKEVNEQDKIHEVDPKHIKQKILKDRIKEIEDADQPKPPEAPKLPDATLPQINQIRRVSNARPLDIDLVRMRVMRACLSTEKQRVADGHAPDYGPRYVWFPDDNIDIYELHRGNPPPDSRRPKHLRGIDLWVDLTTPPPRVIDYMAERGIAVDGLIIASKLMIYDKNETKNKGLINV